MVGDQTTTAATAGTIYQRKIRATPVNGHWRRSRFMRLIMSGLAVIMFARMSDDTLIVVVRLKCKTPDGRMKSFCWRSIRFCRLNDAVHVHNCLKYIYLKATSRRPFPLWLGAWNKTIQSASLSCRINSWCCFYILHFCWNRIFRKLF